ncbi:MAG: HEAT repeat domain-containing protein [Symploca sp. SIO2E9]|nr:HEAT repeat domain-containing protein [Symploca sp. SIO2E9]
MTMDALFAQLKHPNPNLRERAMQQISETRDEHTIPRLIDVLGEEDVVYRRAAVKTLGVIGPDAVLPLVELLLNSNNTTIQASCTKAMAQIAYNYPEVPFPNEAIEGLKIALNDSNPVVYTTAVMALGEVGSPVLEILVEALNTTDNVALAVAIVNTLGSMGDNRAAEVLTRFSKDESADSYVRESATSALSRLEQVIKFQQINSQRA